VLKTGIWRREQLGRRRSILGRPRAISYGLLRPEHPGAEETALFEDLVAHLRLASGVYRTTRRDRFRAADARLVERVVNRFGTRELSVHDCAVSDGLASTELATALATRIAQVTFTASDQFLCLVECRRAGDASIYILQPDGQGLQAIRPPFVVSLTTPEPPLYPVNRLIQRSALLQLKTVGPLVRRLKWPDPLSPDTQTIGQWSFQQLPLIHPHTAEFRARHHWFNLAVHSVLDPWRAPVHLVRAMNVLQEGYFDHDAITVAAAAAWRSLIPGGLWFVGRNFVRTPLVVDGTVFEKTNTGFGLSERLNGGTEIEALVLSGRFG
jgi:hypothetical protein